MWMVEVKQRSNMPITKLGFIFNPQSLVKLNRHPRPGMLSVVLVRLEVIAEPLADIFVPGPRVRHHHHNFFFQRIVSPFMVPWSL